MSQVIGSINASSMTMRAAADYLGNGAIEINQYELEIADIVRRTSNTITRFKGQGAMKPATGHPHRYFEQTAIATATTTDPRNIAPTPSGATRVERAAMIKATVAQSNFSHFDVEVTKQQNTFSKVEAQDLADITSAIVRKNAKMLWMGTDTSLSAPTTSEWMGLVRQIAAGGNVGYVQKGASIIDGVKAQVAAMVADETYNSMPTAAYLNPILANLIAKEAKATAFHMDKVEFVAGVKVNAIQTEAGELPLPSDAFLPSLSDADLTALGLTNYPSGVTVAYPCVITQENMIEFPYVNPQGNEDPRIFQLGLLSGLQGQFVGLSYQAAIAKGAPYAHSLMIIFA
jgi:hypothetical protein